MMLKSTVFAAMFILPVAALPAQEKSVNPGINKVYEPPDLPDSVKRLESEGRDVYDHRQEVIAALALKPEMAVADVGAGTGLFTRLFSPLVGPKGKVYAVDISKEFIEHIEQLNREQKIENVVGIVCKQDSTELPKESVDLVFVSDTYHHFEYPQKTLRSIREALKPKGQMVVIDYKRIPGVSPDWILGHVRAGQEVFTKEIEEAGFKQIEERKDMLKESYYLRFEKIVK
jgi:predicted methyltransferase